MSAMQCLFCDTFPKPGTTLFRINPKGQAGVWACHEHRDQTDAPRDLAVDDLTRILEKACTK